MSLKLICITVIMLLFMMVLPLVSQEWDDLNLEDLMNITVTTVSKKAEKVSEASAVMTVITAEDIKKMGVRTLDDVLRTVAGVDIIETYYGYSSVTFRGVLQTHYNNKSLLLLNGHPMYETVVGSYYIEAIPVTSVSRIEIIRGPSSVMYGTNAFAGVINIITKKGADITAPEASLTLGSFSTRRLDFISGSSQDGLDITFCGSTKDDDGYPYRVRSDEEGNAGEPAYGMDRDAYENDFTNGLVHVAWKDFSFQLFSWKQEKDKFGLIPTLVSTGESHRKGYGFDVSYRKALSEDREVTLFSWYDKMSKREWINAYYPATAAAYAQHYQDYSGDKMGFDLRYDYPGIAEKTDLLFGVVYETFNSEPYYFRYASTFGETSPGSGVAPVPGEIDEPASSYLDSHETTEKSFYIQPTYRPNERTTFTVGGRLA